MSLVKRKSEIKKYIPLTEAQRIKIQIGAKDLDMRWNKIRMIMESATIDPYHELLSHFIRLDGQPAQSCKDLNTEQADKLLEWYGRLGWSPTVKKPNPYAYLNNRSDKFASPGQLLKILALWIKNSREKTEESLNNFLPRFMPYYNAEINTPAIQQLLRADVSKVITAIENLK